MKWLLNLPILYRVIAIIYLLQGLFFLFGGQNIADQNNWSYSVGFAAMAEHHGSTLICISIFFWFLPSLISIKELRKISILGLAVQAILILMPIYHALFGYFEIDPSFYIMIAVLTLIMVLFYFASKAESEVKI